MAAGFIAAAQSDGSTQLAVKVRRLIHGVGWDGYTGIAGQVLTVAMLLGGGFVVSWTFGREFSDQTIETPVMTRPSRMVLAPGKLSAVLVWAVGVAVTATMIALSLGLLLSVRPGTPCPGWRGCWSAAFSPPRWGCRSLWWPPSVAALWPASARSSPSSWPPTQILTVIGTGGWFPCAAPSLWPGGRPEPVGDPDPAAAGHPGRGSGLGRHRTDLAAHRPHQHLNRSKTSIHRSRVVGHCPGGRLVDPERDDGEDHQREHRHGEYQRRLGRVRQTKSVHTARLSPGSTSNNGVDGRLLGVVGARCRDGSPGVIDVSLGSGSGGSRGSHVVHPIPEGTVGTVWCHWWSL